MDTQTGADLLQRVVGITRLIKDPKEICGHETNMMKEKNKLFIFLDGTKSLLS